MTAGFFINFISKMLIYFSIMWITGLLVIHKGIKVNYTRKINHFALLIVPYLMNILMRRPPGTGSPDGPEGMEIILQIVALLSGLLFLLLFIQPIRTRVKIIDTAFHGIDRPEDRPHTLLWMTTQTAGNFLASIPISIYLKTVGMPELIFILIGINGIGDGLAEPVGIRFGKHKYTAKALFIKKIYTRSLEGSLTVFLVSAAAVLFSAGAFTTTQLIVLLAALPITMTLTEAKAPHTWDNPFLFLTGSLVLYLTLEYVH